MANKLELREIVKSNLDDAIDRVNKALAGDELSSIESTITRFGRNGSPPHWYAGLKSNKTLPNLDGKTIGSVLEMLFVAVLETSILKDRLDVPLRINPARGIDLPDLDLGVKSPSENYCTSEPFFTAYERLYGNEHDCVVMLTDYQTAKKNPPLRLKVISCKYLKGSEVADENLCRIAKSHRGWLMQENPSLAKRVFRFLAYVNQSDWRAKQLLVMVEGLQQPDDWFDATVKKSEREFTKKNRDKLSKNKDLIAEEDLSALKKILEVSPRYVGVLEQIDNWLIEVLMDSSRAPNDNEWSRLLSGDLDGKIGISFALQWRYNFGRLFR